jgi:hypothetical protein
VHSSQFSALISPRRGGAIEVLTRFSDLTNLADVLTRRRESYHELPKHQEHHGDGKAGGTASIHDIERAARLKELPPADAEPRAILVERLIAHDVSQTSYASARYQSLRSWAAVALRATVTQAGATLTVLLDGEGLEKKLEFDAAGGIEVSYQWDRSGVPDGAMFAPELSVFRSVPLELHPEAEVWRSEIRTVARSERGFEETVQGFSITPRWPAHQGGARLRLRP